MNKIDDYELIDKDPEEFMRRGREWIAWEAAEEGEESEEKQK